MTLKQHDRATCWFFFTNSKFLITSIQMWSRISLWRPSHVWCVSLVCIISTKKNIFQTMHQLVVLDVQKWQTNIYSNGWQAHSLCFSALRKSYNYRNKGLKDSIGKAICKGICNRTSNCPYKNSPRTGRGTVSSPLQAGETPPLHPDFAGHFDRILWRYPVKKKCITGHKT